jgi:hypothetical protein
MKVGCSLDGHGLATRNGATPQSAHFKPVESWSIRPTHKMPFSPITEKSTYDRPYQASGRYRVADRVLEFGSMLVNRAESANCDRTLVVSAVAEDVDDVLPLAAPVTLVGAEDVVDAASLDVSVASPVASAVAK